MDIWRSGFDLRFRSRDSRRKRPRNKRLRFLEFSSAARTTRAVRSRNIRWWIRGPAAPSFKSGMLTNSNQMTASFL